MLSILSYCSYFVDVLASSKASSASVASSTVEQNQDGDSIEDLLADEVEKSDLERLFDRAASRVRSLAVHMDPDTLLRLYAHYKQGLDGPCDEPIPSVFHHKQRRKYDAWKSLNGLPKEDAMHQYVEIVKSIDPTFASTQAGTDGDRSSANDNFGLGVSRPVPLEDLMPTCGEPCAISPLYEAVKAGDLKQLQALTPEMNDLNEHDGNGLTALHWAVDRGHFDITHWLLDMGVDVDAVDGDGQTALHYAVGCDRPDFVQLLLLRHASINVKDKDDLTPKDLVETEEMGEIFGKFEVPDNS